MRISQEYNIIYEQSRNKKGYVDGMFTEDNYEAVCKQHKVMKAEVDHMRAEMEKLRITSEQYVDSNVVKANTAAMLLGLKQVITGDKTLEFQL